MKKLIVVKSNDLVRASYKLTLNEQRVILACIAQLDSMHGTLPKDNEFILSVDDLANRIPGLDRRHAFEVLKEASDTLYERDIRFKTQRSHGRMRWVYSMEYIEGEGRVKLGFSQRITPYLMQLRNNFTSYQLEEVAALRGAHSIRLFEMLMQFKSTGVCRITVEEFRFTLQLDKQYPRFVDFKRRVIDPAVADLHAHSNLQIRWNVKRKGRTPVALEFVFGVVDQGRLDLNEPPKKRGRPRQSPAKLTAAYITANAKPGETWEQATNRLKRKNTEKAKATPQ